VARAFAPLAFDAEEQANAECRSQPPAIGTEVEVSQD
jgi:hypothetical protein